MKKVKLTDEQLDRYFWEAHTDTLCTPRQVAIVRKVSESCLANERSQGKGPKYIKIANSNILYQKKDILEFLNIGEENEYTGK